MSRLFLVCSIIMLHKRYYAFIAEHILSLYAMHYTFFYHAIKVGMYWTVPRSVDTARRIQIVITLVVCVIGGVTPAIGEINVHKVSFILCIQRIWIILQWNSLNKNKNHILYFKRTVWKYFKLFEKMNITFFFFIDYILFLLFFKVSDP